MQEQSRKKKLLTFVLVNDGSSVAINAFDTAPILDVIHEHFLYEAKDRDNELFVLTEDGRHIENLSQVPVHSLSSINRLFILDMTYFMSLTTPKTTSRSPQFSSLSTTTTSDNDSSTYVNNDNNAETEGKALRDLCRRARLSVFECKEMAMKRHLQMKGVDIFRNWIKDCIMSLEARLRSMDVEIKEELQILSNVAEAQQLQKQLRETVCIGRNTPLLDCVQQFSSPTFFERMSKEHDRMESLLQAINELEQQCTDFNSHEELNSDLFSNENIVNDMQDLLQQQEDLLDQYEALSERIREANSDSNLQEEEDISNVEESWIDLNESSRLSSTVELVNQLHSENFLERAERNHQHIVEILENYRRDFNEFFQRILYLKISDLYSELYLKDIRDVISKLDHISLAESAELCSTIRTASKLKSAYQSALEEIERRSKYENITQLTIQNANKSLRILRDQEDDRRDSFYEYFSRDKIPNDVYQIIIDIFPDLYTSAKSVHMEDSGGEIIISQQSSSYDVITDDESELDEEEDDNSGDSDSDILSELSDGVGKDVWKHTKSLVEEKEMKIRQLELSISMLQSSGEYSQLRNAEDELSRLRDQNDVLADENYNLQNRITDLQRSNDRVAETLVALKQQYERVRTESIETTEENNRLRVEVQQLEIAIQSKVELENELSNELDQLHAHTEELEKNLASAKSALQHKTALMAKTMHDNAHLQELVDISEDEVESLEKQLQSKLEIIEELTESLEEAREFEQKYRLEKKNTEDLSQQLETKYTQLQEMKDELNHVTQQHEKVKSELDQKIAELINDNNELQLRVDGLTSDLEKSKKDKQLVLESIREMQSTVGNLKNKIQELQSTLSECTAERDQLQEQIEKIETQSRVQLSKIESDLNDQIEANCDVLKQYSDLEKSAAIQKKALAAKELECKQLQNELVSLRKDLQDIKEEKTSTEHQNAELVRRVQVLEASLAENSHLLVQMEENRSTEMKECMIMKKRCDELSSANSSLQQQCKQLESKDAALKFKNDQLLNNITGLEQSLAKQVSELEKYTKRSESEKKLIEQQYEQRMKLIQAQFDKTMEERTKSLESENELLKKKLEQLETSNKDLTQKNTGLEKFNTDAKALVDRVVGLLSTKDSELMKIKKENDEIKDQAQHLSQRCNSMSNVLSHLSGYDYLSLPELQGKLNDETSEITESDFAELFTRLKETTTATAAVDAVDTLACVKIDNFKDNDSVLFIRGSQGRWEALAKSPHWYLSPESERVLAVQTPNYDTVAFIHAKVACTETRQVPQNKRDEEFTFLKFGATFNLIHIQQPDN